jgi:transcriptional regulator with XRE-family HTH domain
VPTSPKNLPSRAYRTSSRYVTEAKAVGSRVRATRKANGWTLEEAARRAGLEYQHIQKVESGTLNVTLVTLVRLAEGFGVPLSAFFVD